MRFDRAERLRFFVLIGVIGIVGIAATGYMLVHQRLSNPFADTYRVRADLPAADGVVAGLGQPVNVAGVKVGSIVDAQLVDGRAQVTLEIDRGELPTVYRDARVALEPITPLKDMEVNLDPGTSTKPLGNRVIPIGQTSSPVPLQNLLSSLDADTRAYVQTMIDATGRATRGQGNDLRRMLGALGPTTRQIGQITRALAARRREMARLVTNVAVVTRAAAKDRELVSLIQSAERTMAAIAAEDDSLRAVLTKLPGTLDVADVTLDRAARFSRQLGPAADALEPALKVLPKTLGAVKPFATESAAALRSSVRPFVRRAVPLVGDLGAAVPRLSTSMGPIWTAFQAINYAANILAFNPSGSDEGNLFWLAWGGHNANSASSTGDAHGGGGRAMIALNCRVAAETVGDLTTVLRLLTGNADLCPNSKPNP